MSHGKLRSETNCLNCGNQVPERYCPTCGQENTEPRKPFHYLFTHFVEDFTHYDGQFWKSIKLLLFNPGKLTKTYLSGKRQLYVPPVKLYIFMSFMTFLILAFLPDKKILKFRKDIKPEDRKELRDNLGKSEADLQKLRNQGFISEEIYQLSLKQLRAEASAKNKDTVSNDVELNKAIGNAGFMNATNMKEFDSINAKKGFFYTVNRPFAKKYFELKEQGLTGTEIKDKFIETFLHTIPKALFLYMPVFAFLMWLFHNKKKWWYFDHGVFTLHYFSFLLLAYLIVALKSAILKSLGDLTVVTILNSLITLIILVYIFAYFFIAHHRVYESRKRITLIKGTGLMILNFAGIVISLFILVIISFLMMH